VLYTPNAKPMNRRTFLRLLVSAVFFLFPFQSFAQEISPKLYQGMRWRMIGPFRGGRSVAVTGVRGQCDVYYFGAVGGGVWKTTNGGLTWQPISDSLPIGGIGALAVAPSDPNVIYIGTGEADIRSDLSIGGGAYKSSDGGHTWTSLGLQETRQIGRILVDPRDANTLFVAALGHAYGPNPDRGVYRSTDGGKTWQKVLFKNANTGAVDLAFDPDDPHTIYAALWNAHRPPWSQYPPIGGPGSGVYKSVDGGSNWSQINGTGLPTGDWGRVGIAVAKREGGNRIYALIEAKDQSGLYRSDDGGKSWRRVNSDSRIHGREWYFSGVTVDPRNPDVVYLPNVSLYRSTDGGQTIEPIKGAPGGDDYHFMWVDPDDSSRMAVASDQGTVISTDGGKSWSSWYNQPTAQLYHVSVDNDFPYHVYGAQQDSGTAGTTSRGDYGQITFRDWAPVGGGESGYIVVDPNDANTIYAGSVYGELHRFDRRTGQSHVISPLVIGNFGAPISKAKYRFTWTSPLAFSTKQPGVLYMGSQYLLKTVDRGLSWQPISPDLTGADPKTANATGPVTVDNAKARGYGVIYTVAPSSVDAGTIWTGSDSGAIFITRDGGKNWSNVTPQGLADWSKISILDASPFDAGTAYAAVDCHRLDDYTPYIYRTHDFGKSWTKISNGIAAPAYVHAVREDPKRKGLLYAGTETGIYVSFDDGDHWQPLQLNLPAAPVHDLVVKDNDLVIATHGRSFWILDNLAPLREITPEIAGSNVHLFKPETAIRIRRNINEDTPLPPETPAGKNPPTGAIIDYYLASAPDGEVTLEILDRTNQVVRRYSSSDKPAPHDPAPPFPHYWFQTEEPLGKAAGMNRFVWDFRYARPRTTGHRYSMATVYGENDPTLPEGVLALPGDYQARLTVNGKSYTQAFTVVMDPRVKTSAEELAKQFEAEKQISSAIERNASALSAAQNLRDQLKPLRQQASDRSQTQNIVNNIDALDRKIVSLAGGEQRRSDQTDASPNPTLTRINGSLATLLTVVDSADAPPSTQAMQAFEDTQKSLDQLLATWQQIQQKELAQLNQLLRRAGLTAISINNASQERLPNTGDGENY
jgi:photosystem II stability/assembly factor-like uncharacterized protein